MINSIKKDGTFNSDGQYKWIKLINSPLMWEPSWSCTKNYGKNFIFVEGLSVCLVERIVSIKQEQNNKRNLRRTWSVINIKWPYLKDFTLAYSLCCWSPRRIVPLPFWFSIDLSHGALRIRFDCALAILIQQQERTI